ncbi:hypothetical protein GJ744_004169 [Endocarpon pusillum]|uniref:Uncharacterized protein n=1 Tax=Endocarpon pusillum TaxID=364733 RepID=A0A8H7AR91_9EURO|nr:hypothetical protein GJ744_004169 [Endocarpon pusillum]
MGDHDLYQPRTHTLQQPLLRSLFDWMFAMISDILGRRTHGANSVSLQRTATMATSSADRGTGGRRVRSGSAPTEAIQETTDGAQEKTVSALPITSPPGNLQSPSRMAAHVAQQDSLLEIDDNNLKLVSELNHAVKLNANLKEHIRCAGAELKSTVQERDALRNRLTEYERREQSKNGELVQAKADIQHLKKCLDDCKERIFKMQPLEHLTDSEIAEQYRTLCDSISDWTDSQFGDYDNPLGMLDACFATETPTKLIHAYLIRDGLMEVVKKCPTAAFPIITYLIHRHVYQSVLRENLCFPGLDPQCEDFVFFMANAMKNNEPRRGIISPFMTNLTID